MKPLIIFILFIFTTSFLQKNDLSKDKLIGSWVCQYSWEDGIKVDLQKNSFNPIYVMKFLECNDNIVLKDHPIIVQNIRKRNYLKNIKCINYFLDGRIATTYPTLAKNSDRVLIRYYGRKHKGSYLINSLDDVKMVIRNRKNTLHVYIKK